MSKRRKEVTPEMVDLLRATASADHNIAQSSLRELAIALTMPLRMGVVKGDIVSNIFEDYTFQPGASIEFPLDFLSPGTEKNFVAYTIPGQGKIPFRHIEGDYVMVPTYDVGGSIDWRLKYARDARWDIVERAMEVLEASFIRKNNQDAWHTLLAAGVGRNVIVYDDQAPSGLFTKRLVALGKTTMRRKAGGNSTSINKGRLTDLYMSPESLEDMRSWDLTQIDDFTRRQIFVSGGADENDESALAEIFKVRIHDIDELGVGQEFQTYYTSNLSGTLPTDKQECLVGLDLYNNDSFVHPIRQELAIYEDMQLHRELRAGMYGFLEHGYSVLDSRRVLMFAL